MSIDTGRMTDRLKQLVLAETPSADEDLLLAAYQLIRKWGDEALGRTGEIVWVEGTPHLWWPALTQPSTLVLGHVDTVWPAGTTAQRPFAVEDGRAAGPGVFDMKAGIVIAMDAIALAGDTAHISVLLTGDEETGSRTSRALIEKAARDCAAVLVLEPSLDGALKTGRKGGSIYEVTFQGKAAHAGLEPHLGRNALVELSRFVLACEAWSDPAAGTTVTPTKSTAGTANNIVPDHAMLTIDVRAETLAELDRVDREIGAMASTDPDVSIRVDGGINRPPLEVASSTDLMAIAHDIAAAEGLPEPRSASVGGASDANFTAALGIPTLDGLGAIGDGAHALHEWVDLGSLGDRAALVAGLLRTLAPR